MRNNLSTTDKTIRATIAITIGILVFSRVVAGPLALTGFIFGLALVITCLKGNCPFYRLLGINTNKNLNDKARMYERNIYERNQILIKNYMKNYRESSYRKEF